MGGQGGCERNVGGRGDVGYKKVLYNIKKMKNVGGGRGRGQYLNPKHYVFKKEKEKKSKKIFLTEPGFEPTTSGLEIH